MNRAVYGLVLGALSGCQPSASDPTSTLPTGDTAGTTTPVQTGPGVFCASKKSAALHVKCGVELETADAVDLSLTDLDGSVRVFSSEDMAQNHELVLWRLRAETTYGVQAVSRGGAEVYSGSFTTDPLPEYASFDTVVTGEPSFPYVMSNHKCSGSPIAYVLDDEGQMVWYQDVTQDTEGLISGGIEGFEPTERGFLAVVGKRELREFSWEGELLFSMSFPGALPFPIHHDVTRKNGRTYVLFAEEVLGLDQAKYVLDGVLILDDQGVELGRIRLADHVAPTGGGQLGGYWNAHYPDAVDFTHSNGLFVDDEGNVLWSLRLQNTVLKFAADPDRADFGQLLWAANGDGSGAFGSDFAFGNNTVFPEPEFEFQHHPNLDDQGRLLLFDNREGLLDHSRATVWRVNEEQSAFTLEEAWELPLHCLFQGSTFPMANGHVLATCSSNETIYEFAPGMADPVATLNVPCEAAPGTLMVRGQPMNFGDLVTP